MCLEAESLVLESRGIVAKTKALIRVAVTVIPNNIILSLFKRALYVFLTLNKLKIIRCFKSNYKVFDERESVVPMKLHKIKHVIHSTCFIG